MSKKLIIAAALMLAGTAVPALAQTATCTVPTAPAAIDGSTATKDQMIVAHKAVVQFMSDSDLYQKCLSDNMTAEAAAAKASGGKYDPKAEAALGNDNQAQKEKVGSDYNTALGAYKKAQATKQ